MNNLNEISFLAMPMNKKIRQIKTYFKFIHIFLVSIKLFIHIDIYIFHAIIGTFYNYFKFFSFQVSPLLRRKRKHDAINFAGGKNLNIISYCLKKWENVR